MAQEQPIYGIIAEFDGPEALVAAARRAHDAGYRQMDGYTPFAVEGLSEAIGRHRTRLPLLVLIGGCVGALGGYLLQFWTMAIDYPINVAGRPLNSWPAWLPVTFETTVLCAALAAVLGMLWLNGLPSPYHPVFNVPEFELASRNRFFLCIRSHDPSFDQVTTRAFLQNLEPLAVTEVSW
jgi:hypothetical protein